MQEINELIFPLSSNVEEYIPVDDAEEHFLTVLIDPIIRIMLERIPLLKKEPEQHMHIE